MGSNLITCCSVMHWVWTTHGMKRPQRTKSISSVRLLEHGIEETYRDWHHHWAVRAAVVGLPTEAMVARLIGVVCLAYTVQMHLGQRVSRDPRSQQRRAQWTVTDRIRWFWCGQRLFTDPGYDWSSWLAQQWESLGQGVSMAPAPPVSKTASLAALEEA